MDGIQITGPKKLSTITKKENFSDIDSTKVIITKAMLIREDFNTYRGDDKATYPVIPGRIGIGKISALPEEDDDDENGLKRGMRVFPHPEVACGACHECFNGNDKRCAAFNIAGKNTDGFLRDFVVVKNDALSILPPSVTDYEALFIDHVALCVNVIDKIDLKKGDHVVIVGGDLLGIFLAQLVIYYQGIPIIVDNNEENLNLASRSGVYYTLFADNKVEKSVSDLTGARLASKVVYMTGANLNTDFALKLAGQHGTVCFAGFGAPTVKVNFNTALIKQLNFNCITSGYGNINSAINLLANKAVDISVISIPTVKQSQAMETIKEMSQDQKYLATSGMVIVDIV